MNPIRHAFVINAVALSLCLAGSLLAHAAEAPPADSSLVGRVFPETSTSAPAFLLERSTKTTGDTSVLTERFKDMQGNPVAVLKSTYVAGALQSIDFEQNQSKESASAVFKDGRVFFTQTENGNTKKGDQEVVGKWVPLSAVPDEITKNWDTVASGKPLEFAIPVPIMRDHFKFTVVKQRSWTENGKTLTEFKMQPSSMVIRMMADAFYYVFDEQSHALVEYRGVTIAKTGESGKLKDLKARITYSQGQ
jgi:hypothetical protein